MVHHISKIIRKQQDIKQNFFLHNTTYRRNSAFFGTIAALRFGQTVRYGTSRCLTLCPTELFTSFFSFLACGRCSLTKQCFKRFQEFIGWTRFNDGANFVCQVDSDKLAQSSNAAQQYVHGQKVQIRGRHSGPVEMGHHTWSRSCPLHRVQAACFFRPNGKRCSFHSNRKAIRKFICPHVCLWSYLDNTWKWNAFVASRMKDQMLVARTWRQKLQLQRIKFHINRFWHVNYAFCCERFGQRLSKINVDNGAGCVLHRSGCQNLLCQPDSLPN